MLRAALKTLRTAPLALILSACAATGALDCAPDTKPGMVTTLYFGLSRPGKPDVTTAEWRDFLVRDLLAGLPGATVVEGLGAFREPGGALATEATRVVTIGHHGGETERRALATLIARYKARFDQWGVGRIESSACTNFH